VSDGRIPFNKPCLAGREFEYISRAIEAGHISGDGSFTKRCGALLESKLGVARALLTTSCTHALEMAALLLRLRPGDEVILPTFTFVSTVNAFVLHGGTPVFSDVRADTLNLDEMRLEALITPRTKAVAVVHYGGVGCEMDAIVEIARRHGLAVIEDNAHGLFGRYRQRYLGTFGALAAQSFHETKNFSCGEGGALLINDPALVERAEILREKGTNRSRFFRGQVDKYTWVDVGSSYLPSDILAAFLWAQLEARERIQARRREIWTTYFQGLGAWAEERNVRLPVIPPYCDQTYHLFHMLMPTGAQRDALIAHLKEQNIMAVFHYLPLHASDMGHRFGGHPGQCPVAEDASERLVRLPFYNDLTPDEQQRVVDAVRDFKGTA
jgi:dTDP-4-amino-4,6-dideoxygalactose transaminase